MLLPALIAAVLLAPFGAWLIALARWGCMEWNAGGRARKWASQ